MIPSVPKFALLQQLCILVIYILLLLAFLCAKHKVCIKCLVILYIRSITDGSVLHALNSCDTLYVYMLHTIRL